MAGGRRRALRHCTRIAPSFLLAAALLVASTAVAHAQLDGCAANPSQDACKDYTVEPTVLETDLSRLCASSALGGATYSGWPSACSLWHECQAGRATADSCQPLALLQTACNEPGAIESEICMTYLLLCAPGSKVQQCADQPPIRQLKPPMQFYSAVQRLCTPTSNSTAGDGGAAAASGAVANASLELEPGSEDAAAMAAACRTCSAMSEDPSKVVVQATQANCPDPLGTLSTLCLLVGDAPSANVSCAGWAALCTSDVGAGFWSLCGGAGPAPAPAPAAAEDNERANAASAPQQASGEAGARVPATGTVPGTTSAGGSPAPAPASSGSGSTSATTSGGGSGSASNDATVTFQKMYLHASMSAVILFKEWVPTSGGAYVASCLAIIALAVLVQALKALSHQIEGRWEAQRRAGAFADSSGSGSPTYGHVLSRSSMESQIGHEPRRSSAMSTMPMLRGMGSGAARSSLSNGVDGGYVLHQQPQQFVTRDELTRNTQRALFTGATVFLDLMLMLVVMTFNLGLILSVTLGYMLGALAFGHLRERVPVAAPASGAKAVATNPLFIVGSMQPTAEEPFDPLHQDQQRSLRQIHTQA